MSAMRFIANGVPLYSCSLTFVLLTVDLPKFSDEAASLKSANRNGGARVICAELSISFSARLAIEFSLDSKSSET